MDTSRTEVQAVETEERKRERLFEATKELLKQGLPAEEIADVTGLAESEVRSVMNEMEEDELRGI